MFNPPGIATRTKRGVPNYPDDNTNLNFSSTDAVSEEWLSNDKNHESSTVASALFTRAIEQQETKANNDNAYSSQSPTASSLLAKQVETQTNDDSTEDISKSCFILQHKILEAKNATSKPKNYSALHGMYRHYLFNYLTGC